MAREALFNILHHQVDFEDINMLDLFAGTGAVSLEFVSRGCTSVTAIDINYRCVQFIEKTFADFDVENAKVIRANAIQFLKKCDLSYQVIFVDPPYNMENIDTIIQLVFQNKILAENGILILEHSEIHDFSSMKEFSESRKYGKVHFSFFI